jgi:hypothetical protein
VLFDWEPWDYQAEVLDAPEDAEHGETRVTWVAGRQVGKSRTSGLIPADYALTHAGEDVLIGSRFQSTSDELFRECKSHLENTGLSESELGIETANQRTYEFDTGARILSRTLGTDGSQARGLHPSCIVLDEAALLSSEIVETVVLPMLASHSTYELYLVSTPLSREGFLYEKHTNDPSWQSYHVPTSASPLVDDDWIEARRKEADSTTFRREYRGEFVSGSRESYLPREIIEPCISTEGKKLTGDLFLGVDVAHAGDDRSVYLAVDEHGNTRIEAAIDQQTVPAAVDLLRELDQQNGYASVKVDSQGGLGAAVEDYTDGLPNVSGQKFTSRSKATMYQRLKRLLEGKELSLPNNQRMIHELTSLTYDFTTSGILQVKAQSGHDDYPDALALALEARANGSVKEEWNGLRNKAVLGSIRQQPSRSLRSLMDTR